MQLIPESSHLEDYLPSTAIIDFDCPEISLLSDQIFNNTASEPGFVQKAYEFVRDHISHSADINGAAVTCKASDVLNAGEGICYAKSHLLAALLRKNNIPVGFCYQLLRLHDDDSPLVLHGLNAVYLRSLGRWIRLDARGNKADVDARFSIDREQLAFPVRPDKGEVDYPFIFIEPDGNAVHALEHSVSVNALWANLPSALSRIL